MDHTVRGILRGLAVAGAACLTGVACVPAMVGAQDSQPDVRVASPHSVTGNITLVSDYRFRGISQTYMGPGIQGGLDYAHASGFYLGNWNSSVSSQMYTGGSGIEMDFYGGFKKSRGDVGVDLGVLLYHYPNAASQGTGGATRSFDTAELYAGASWKWMSMKYSHALGEYFGLGSMQVNGGYWSHQANGALLPDRGGSTGTGYLDLTAVVPIPGQVALTAHAGRLRVSNYGELDYTDWKCGVSRELHGLVFGAAAIGSNANRDWYYTAGAKGNRSIGSSTMVISLNKTF